jgi:hypothetical protein
MTRQRREDEGRVTAGSGSPEGQSVEARAREIARIEHPESPEVTQDDRARARDEFRGAGILTSVEDPEPETLASRNPADPPHHIAHARPAVVPEDPQKELEGRVLEGVNEADHQRMLAAREEEAAEGEEEEA